MKRTREAKNFCGETVISIEMVSGVDYDGQQCRKPCVREPGLPDGCVIAMGPRTSGSILELSPFL